MRFAARRRVQIESTLKLLELLSLLMLVLEFLSDVKLNPFLGTLAEWSRPIFLERFRLSSICMIPKELPEEVTLEMIQALSDFLSLLPLSYLPILAFAIPTVMR